MKAPGQEEPVKKKFGASLLAKARSFREHPDVVAALKKAGDVKSAAVSKAKEMADKRRGAHQGGATIEFFDEAEEDPRQQGRRISGMGGHHESSRPSLNASPSPLLGARTPNAHSRNASGSLDPSAPIGPAVSYNSLDRHPSASLSGMASVTGPSLPGGRPSYTGTLGGGQQQQALPFNGFGSSVAAPPARHSPNPFPTPVAHPAVPPPSGSPYGVRGRTGTAVGDDEGRGKPPKPRSRSISPTPGSRRNSLPESDPNDSAARAARTSAYNQGAPGPAGPLPGPGPASPPVGPGAAAAPGHTGIGRPPTVEERREAVRKTFRIPPIPPDLSEEDVIRHVQALMGAVEADLKEAMTDKEKRWAEEKSMLELMLGANQDKRAILVKEVERTKGFLMKQQTGVEGRPGDAKGGGAGKLRGVDMDKLVAELQRVKELERRTEDEVVKSTRSLASCPDDEREIWETKVSAHRDTLKLVKLQMNQLESQLRILREEDAASNSTAAGWTELSHLNEELIKIESEIDSIKRQTYFPDYQGWQIRMGSAGVYLGAKDIILSKISGGFRAAVSRYVRKNSAEAYVVLSVSLGAADSGQLGRLRSQPSASGMAEMTTDEDLDAGYDDAHSLFSALDLERVAAMGPDPRDRSGPLAHSSSASSLDQEGAGGGAASWLELATVEPSRQERGLVVLLRAEQLQLKADRGTRVPDLAFKELALRIDVSADVDLEYSPRHGWRVPGSINLTVHSIEKESKGGTLPIPTSQIGALLPLILPPILKKVLPRLFPVEIGDYLVQAHSIDEGSDPLLLRGSISIQGPELEVLMADFSGAASLSGMAASKSNPTFGTRPPTVSSGGGQGRAGVPLMAALRVLGLEPQQALVLQDIYIRKLRCSSDYQGRTVLTLQELIRYHKKINRSDRVYEMTCTIWEQILDYFYAPYGGTPFSFRDLMDRVGRMADEKPVRLKLSIQELSWEVDADAALKQLHKYFVRVARELHTGMRQRKKGSEPTQPIDQQLRAADEWMSQLQAILARYKEGFGGAKASVVTAVQPAAALQAMAQGLSYEGPLAVQVPMGTSEYPGGPLTYDVSFPGLAKKKGLTRALESVPDIPDEIKRHGTLVKISLDGVSVGLRLDMDALAKALLPAAPELTADRGDYRESTLQSLVKACTSSYADLASFYIERGDTEPPPALDPELGQRDKFGLKITSNELARMVVRAERLRAQTDLSASQWARLVHAILVHVGKAQADLSPAWFHPIDNLNLSLQLPMKAGRSKKNHLCLRLGYSHGLSEGGPQYDRGPNPAGPQVMQLDLSTEMDWKRILAIKELGDEVRQKPGLVTRVLNRKEGDPLVKKKKKVFGR